jgi:hypothetical protein
MVRFAAKRLGATQLQGISTGNSIAFKHHFQFQPKITDYEKPFNRLGLVAP